MNPSTPLRRAHPRLIDSGGPSPPTAPPLRSPSRLAEFPTPKDLGLAVSDTAYRTPGTPAAEEQLVDALRQLARSVAPSPLHREAVQEDAATAALRPRSSPTLRVGETLPPLPVSPPAPAPVPLLAPSVPTRRRPPVEGAPSASEDTPQDVPGDKTNPPLEVEDEGLPTSVVTVLEFFLVYGTELRLDKKMAERFAERLAHEELLFTTEDLYLLRDRDLFCQLPLPLHVRRWLLAQRDHILADPRGDGRLGWSSPGTCSVGTVVSASSVVQQLAFPLVEVTIQVNAISDLNVQHMVFDTDFTLMLDWKDPSAVGMSVEDVQDGTLFNPDVVLDNPVEGDQPIAGSNSTPRIHRAKHGICSDGHMKRTCRYRARLKVPDMDLRAFPFDTQLLPIRLKARNHRGLTDEDSANDFPIVLVGPEGAAGANGMDGLRKSGHTADPRADQLSEWKIHSLMGIRTETADRYYEMQIVILRDPGHVMWNVAFPTMMILLFGFTVYGLPISELGSRLEITGTCLLAMMAFQGTIKEMLPPMPYLTAIGKYVIATFVVLLCHGFEHAFVFLLTSGSTEDPWRTRPADYFFGSVRLWDETSERPVKGESVWVISEFCLLILLHMVFFWYTYRERLRGLELRRPRRRLPASAWSQGQRSPGEPAASGGLCRAPLFGTGPSRC